MIKEPLMNNELVMKALMESVVVKRKSLLQTTLNTRELGGYPTVTGKITKYDSFVRSDEVIYPTQEDATYLIEHHITNIIDLRGKKDVLERPNGFAHSKEFLYLNCPIEEGSRVPESIEAVSQSYIKIANAVHMIDVFRQIAHAEGGVLFHCTAGKDRTGVVSAILLCHAGVSDADVIENYMLTKEYNLERFKWAHKCFPEVDMRIVIPNEMYIKEFLRYFRELYEDTSTYFKKIGLQQDEISRIRDKLVDPLL